MKNLKINKFIFSFIVILTVLLSGILLTTTFKQPEQKTEGVTGTIKVIPKIYWYNNPLTNTYTYEDMGYPYGNVGVPKLNGNYTLRTGTYQNSRGIPISSIPNNNGWDYFIGYLTLTGFDTSGTTAIDAIVNERGQKPITYADDQEVYLQYVWNGSSKRTLDIDVNLYSKGFGVSNYILSDSPFSYENSSQNHNITFNQYLYDEFSLSVDPTIFSSKTTTKYLAVVCAPKRFYAEYSLYSGEYFGDGTTGVKSINIRFGDYYSVPSGTPRKNHYTFEKWNAYRYGPNSKSLDISNSVLFTDPDMLSISARWIANTETIKLMRNDNTQDFATTTIEWGYSIPNVSTPTRAGYSFLGYFDSASGGTQYIDANGKGLKSHDLENATLYAHWLPNQYTVTFNANGGSIPSSSNWTGSGSSAQKSLNFDSNYGTLPNPTRTGYNFTGWYTASSGGSKVESNTILKNANNHTLYAHWDGKPYTVVYNPGYSGASAASHTGFKYGSSTALRTISALGFSRNGYDFKGWATSKNGGVVYSNGQSVSNLSSNGGEVNLFAVWQAKTYTLTANANGGSIPTTSGWSGSGASATKTITFDSTYGTLPTPTRTGHTFAGWYTAASSGEAVSATTGVTTTGNRTIYAHWTVNSYTLTADANMTGATFTSVPSDWNGSGTTRTRSVIYNTSYGTLPTPAKEGYIFLGWYTAASGGSSVYSTTTMGAGNTRIYAHWERTWAADATGIDLSGLGGSGTVGDPYIIDSELDIAFLALQTSKNVTFDGKYFKQNANIDLAGKTWLPIGNATTAFQGSYDGNGYLITNITTIANGQLNYSNVGLFGYTRNATIKNVNIISGTIQGYDYVGSIVGNLNNGSIENCRSGATVTGHNYVGMIGYGVSTSILSSYNYGNVSGNDCVGGILGYNDGTGTRLENCYMKGSVTASASNADCGGILGQTSTSGITLQSCGFIGSVTGGSNTGLLTGNLNGGSVIDCFANSTTNYAFTKGSGIVKSSLYIQNKDKDNQVKKYVTHNSETNPFANWTIAVNNQPLPKGFSWISSNGGNLTMEKLEKLGYTA